MFQSAELQNRLVDVESTALRHGKKIIAKLEERVRGLEDELGKLFNVSAFVLRSWRGKRRTITHSSFLHGRPDAKEKVNSNKKDPSLL